MFKIYFCYILSGPGWALARYSFRKTDRQVVRRCRTEYIPTLGTGGLAKLSSLAEELLATTYRLLLDLRSEFLYFYFS